MAIDDIILPPPRRPWRRRLARLAGILAAVYLGLCVMFGCMQTKIIFPGASTQGTPAAVYSPPADVERLTFTTPGGISIAAIFAPALTPDGQPHPDASHRPTLIYFYGNAMCLRDAAQFELGFYRRLGLNVLIPEYMGYGMSGGNPSEQGCYQTADAAWAHLLTRGDIDPKKIIAGGWSLGAAVAIDLAARKPLAGVIAFCAFTSAADMGSGMLPFVPVNLLLRHRFESEKKLVNVPCPILIGHGREDEIVPYAMSDRLAMAARGRVTRLTIDNCGHNDFYDTGRAQIAQAVAQFVDRLK